MFSKVEKGKDISVLVEQAFPSCILVSFQHGNKTFRGVLLDESSKTSIISRTNPSDMLAKADSPDNLGLTTSRVTTCQSDMHHIPSGRMNTRSSAMMLRDGREVGEEPMTPVHKIRGLVERLTQRPRKPSNKLQAGEESCSNKVEGWKKSEAPQTSGQQETTLVNTQGGKVDNKGVKRKSTDATCEPLLKAAKTNDRLDNVHDRPKQEIAGQSKNRIISTNQSSPRMPCKSPLFPILKLKRTSYADNSYVAITSFSKVEAKLNNIQNGTLNSIERIAVPTVDKPSTENQPNSGSHEHNTRFSARKKENTSSKTKKGDETPDIPVPQRKPVVVNPKPQMSENGSTSSKAKSNSVIQNMSKRHINPKKIHNTMKVGDIAWGKVHGHPWWPCRVLGILCDGSEHDGTHQIVKVTWYGSPTTSDISCSLLLTFQEHFRHLYKKQKRGAYQVAVREAQQDLERCSFPATQVLPA